jgi:8-oxo-dGTP pyrophosphatase MutT (NUDIX family)
MIYQEKPEDFNPIFSIVSCYVEHNGRILLLHRQSQKPEGNRWGLPAGKIDEGESELEAMVREIKEETGQEFSPKALEYLDKVYVKYPEYHFLYHMFRVKLEEELPVSLSSKEHQDFQWLEPELALQLDLVRDLDKCLKLSYNI